MSVTLSGYDSRSFASAFAGNWKMSIRLTRRTFLKSTGTAGAASVLGGFFMPSISRAADRPVITHGVQSGDVTANSARIWARADRPSRMIAEIATTEGFSKSVKLPYVDVLTEGDLAGKLALTDLPAGQDIFYKIHFENLDNIRATSEPIIGHFRTNPMKRRNIRFAWSGDTAGQGWGIDEDRGGMKTYATITAHQPDFFIHSGDTIYADGPFMAEQKMPDGQIWKNLTTEGTGKVAETLDEFRANYKYNMLDKNVREFNRMIPVYYQWDDHEVLNNWYPGEMLTTDDRYTEKSVSLLAARANRAFREMLPVREQPQEPGRVYRTISYGPSLEIFVLDMRSYRGPNDSNNSPVETDKTAFMGKQQIEWLKRALLNSKATWKVIAADMPIGMIIYDDWKNKSTFENLANGDGAPAGRELEIVDLLRFIKSAKIRNTVWLTADVHYTAAHYYDPAKAQFTDFDPFWEFVSGPLHAGTFGPNDMDNTFGPEVKFAKYPGKEQGINLPPSAGMQFFGLIDIDGESEQLRVSLCDVADTELYTVTLDPVYS
tara:strand:- start:38145 stop:39782 length:1638 start_codon:yes stop_codon:yes gene_type:complete